MKLSSDKLSQSENIFPVSDWQPADFLSEPPIQKPTRDVLAKDNVNKTQAGKVPPASGSLLVKVPLVDVDHSKRVFNAAEGQSGAVLWTPIDFNAAVEEPEEIAEEIDRPGDEQETTEVDVPSGPTEEELRRQAELLEEIERKHAEADAVLEEAHRQAEAVLNQAREQSAEMISQAHEQMEQIKKQAFEEGALQARLESEEQLHRVAVIIEETQNWRQRMLDQSEETLIKMLQVMARKLFGDGFALDVSSVEEMIGRAITEANRLGNLRVYINPDDHNMLLSVWQESDLVVNGQKIQLIPSQNILQGGCFVEGEFGVVDSRIDVQLDILENELNSTLNSREQEKQRQAELAAMEEAAALKESREVPMPDLAALEQVQLSEQPRQETQEADSQNDLEDNPLLVNEQQENEQVNENDSQSE